MSSSISGSEKSFSRSPGPKPPSSGSSPSPPVVVVVPFPRHFRIFCLSSSLKYYKEGKSINDLHTTLESYKQQLTDHMGYTHSCKEN